MCNFLKSPEAIESIMNPPWKQNNEDPSIVIAAVLQSWELQECHFAKAENSIVNFTNETFLPIREAVQVLERQLKKACSTKIHMLPDDKSTFYEEDVDEVAPYVLIREFRLPVAEETASNQSDVPVKPLLSTWNFGTMRRNKKQEDVQIFLAKMLSNDDIIKSLVLSELKPTIDYILARQKQLSQHIETNLKLVQTLQKLNDEKKGFFYKLIIGQLHSVLGKIVAYQNSYLREYEFPAGCFKISDVSHFDAELGVRKTQQGEIVTLVHSMMQPNHTINVYDKMMHEKMLR